MYGPQIHDYILLEIEVGQRVAMMQDSEDCGWSAITDLQYLKWVREYES